MEDWTGSWSANYIYAKEIYDDWQLMEGSFTVRGDATRANIYARIEAGVTSGDFIYIDDVEIYSLDENYVDRELCDFVTAPMVLYESTPFISAGATWARTSAEFFSSAYSYILTKTDSTAAARYVLLVDSFSSADMHGFLPGMRLKFSARVKFPSTNTGTPYIQFGDYYSGSWHYDDAITTVTDEWVRLTVEKTINEEATGVIFLLGMNSLNVLNDVVYYDNIEIIEITTDDNNLINRGDCESSLYAPSVNRKGPWITSGTWARDATVSKFGSYSWKLTKTAAAGTAMQWSFTEGGYRRSDMQGMIPGRKYKLSCWSYVPSVGGPSDISECQILTCLDYSGARGYSGWLGNNGTQYSTVYDEWEYHEYIGTIHSDCTAVLLRGATSSLMDAGEFFYIDQVRLELLFTDYELAYLNGADSLRHLFEGYHYQAPEVTEDNSLLVNKLLNYRALDTDQNAIEYISTVEDTESQGRDGIFEQKITYPSYVDEDTIANISNAILQRRGAPEKVINLSSVDLRNLLACDKKCNFIDRGNCESNTAPMVRGETTPYLQNATWARSTAEKYSGASSYRITKTTAASAGESRAYLVDSASTGDLHGLIPGHTYKLIIKTKLPSASGAATWQTRIFFRAYDLSWSGASNGPTSLDVWEELELELEVPDSATGIEIFCLMNTSAELNEYFHVDVIRLEDITPGLSNARPDYRDQNLIDRGNCESVTPPMVINETEPLIVSFNWERTTEQVNSGSYAYKATKLNSAGSSAYLSLMDNSSLDDMHGIVAGFEYRLRARVYAPTASGVTPSEIGMRFVEDGADVTEQKASVLDEWEALLVDVAIAFDTTRVRIDFFIDSTAELNEYFYVDDIRLELKTKVPLSFGKYLIENRRQDYWEVAAYCDTLEGWNIDNTTTTDVTISKDRVLTGRRAIKCVTGNGSSGEYIEYNVDPKINFPLLSRIFIYFETTAVGLIITFYDSEGDEVNIIFNISGDTLEVNQPPVDDLEVNQPPTDLLEVNFLTTVSVDTWTRFRADVSSLRDVVRVRVTFQTDAISTIYIDRLDNKSKEFKPAKLFLEEARYNLSKVGLFADLFFGEAETSLVDEINDQVEEGSVALQIFSKQ